MARFLALALPALGLTIALFAFVWESLGYATAPELPGSVRLGSWALESVALTALFLLIRRRGGAGCIAAWLDGLAAGWIAWVFRGPLLLLTLVGVARQEQEPWFSVIVGWLVLYSLCGLILGNLSLLVDPGGRKEEDEEDAAAGLVPVEPAERSAPDADEGDSGRDARSA